MIERLRAWVLAGAAGEFFSLEVTFCWWPFHPRLRQRHIKDQGHSAKSAGGRLHLNTHTPLLQRGVGWLCCPGIVWGPSGKWAHPQLIREHLATVISACWATVDWFWPKMWNWCVWADLHLTHTQKCRPGNLWKSHHHHHHLLLLSFDVVRHSAYSFGWGLRLQGPMCCCAYFIETTCCGGGGERHCKFRLTFSNWLAV